MANRFCRNCGKPLPEGVNFCPSCGTKVSEEQTTSITAMMPPLPKTVQKPKEENPVIYETLTQAVPPVSKPNVQQTQPMYTQPQPTWQEPPRRKKKSRWWLWLLIFLLLLLSGMGIGYIFSKQMNEKTPEPTPTPSEVAVTTPAPTPEATATPTPTPQPTSTPTPTPEKVSFSEKELEAMALTYFHNFYVDYITCTNRGDMNSIANATPELKEALYKRYKEMNEGFTFSIDKIWVDQSSMKYTSNDKTYTIQFNAGSNVTYTQGGQAKKSSPKFHVTMEIDENKNWVLSQLESDRSINTDGHTVIDVTNY